jgi:5-methylcytosine-specific restriction endonuclease McrA
MSAKSKRTENPVNAARHCLSSEPYCKVVYASTDHWGTPLFSVEGSTKPPRKAAKALREAFNVHGGVCFYCKKPIARKKLTIDHAEALAAGGKDELQNLLIAHKSCNVRKGRLPIECYNPKAGRAWLKALLAQVQDRLNRI